MTLTVNILYETQIPFSIYNTHICCSPAKNANAVNKTKQNSSLMTTFLFSAATVWLLLYVACFKCWQKEKYQIECTVCCSHTFQCVYFNLCSSHWIVWQPNGTFDLMFPLPYLDKPQYKHQLLSFFLNVSPFVVFLIDTKTNAKEKKKNTSNMFLTYMNWVHIRTSHSGCCIYHIDDVSHIFHFDIVKCRISKYWYRAFIKHSSNTKKQQRFEQSASYK